ncbi:hypothetical protein GCM10027456_09970 [Kineosporia babensis]
MREIRNNRGRSALIAVMVALPVLAMSVVSVVYQSQTWDLEDSLRAEMGAAQAQVKWQALQPIQQSPDAGGISSTVTDQSELGRLNPAEYGELLAGYLPAGSRLLPQRWTEVDRTQVQWEGMGEWKSLQVREFDYADPGVKGLVEQISGRAPDQAGEVVISETLAKKGLQAGAKITYRPSTDEATKTLTVVGVVGGSWAHYQDAIVGRPGTLLPEELFGLSRQEREKQDEIAVVEWLVVGPAEVSWADVQRMNEIGAVVRSRAVLSDPPAYAMPAAEFVDDYAESRFQQAVIVSVVAGLILLQVALLAGPAIAVGARRNRRNLALMAAAGASRSHLRRVVLASNGLIGLVSSVLAAVLGSLVGVAVIGGLLLWGHTDIPRLDFRITDQLALVLAGTLTVLVTALVPAQQAARMNVAATLTGRRATGSGPVKLLLPLAGLAIAAAGLAVAVQTTRGFIADPAQVVGGLAVFEVGLVMSVGLIMSIAARLVRPLPFSLRFALRDASRQRSRTAPAVAAVLAAVAGGTAGLVYFASAEEQQRNSYSAAGDVGLVAVSGLDPYVHDTKVQKLDRAEQVMAERFGADQVRQYQVVEAKDGVMVTLRPERAPDDVCAGSSGPYPSNPLKTCYWQDRSLQGVGGDIFDDGGTVQILTGGTAAQDVAALQAGRVVVPEPAMLWPDNTVRVEVGRYTAQDPDLRDIEVVTLPAVLATGENILPQPVYPLQAAEKLGVDLVPGGLVTQPTEPLGSAEVSALTAALDNTGQVSDVKVEGGYQDSYSYTLMALLAAVGAIALIGTFTAVGLAAAEAKADVSTLAAVGAGPEVRRWLAASQGAAIAGLGTLLGVVSGAVAGYVLIRLARPDGVQFSTVGIWEFVLPWPHLLLILLGLPLVAAAIGFFTTRAQLPVMRRLGL